MITAFERNEREEFYYHSFRNLTSMHGKPPTHEEMIMYMALILKENPIELSIALLKLKQGEQQNERANYFVDDDRAMAILRDEIQAGD